MELVEESLFVPSGRWDTVTNPSGTSDSSGITIVAERDIVGDASAILMPNPNTADVTNGI